MGMIGNSLAQGLISGANIQDGTVDTPDLKDSAVTTAKINDSAITSAKIADGTIATGDIADGAVTAAKHADGSVTPAKLSTGAPNWDTSGRLMLSGGSNSFGGSLEAITGVSYNSSSGVSFVMGGTDNGYVDTAKASTYRMTVTGDATGQKLSIDRFLRGTGWANSAVFDSAGNMLLNASSVSNAAGWDRLFQVYATQYPSVSLKNSYRQWDWAVSGSSGALVLYDTTGGAERVRADTNGLTVNQRINPAYTSVGNLASNSISSLQSGIRRYSFSIVADNVWRTLVQTINDTTTVMNVLYLSDSASADMAEYAINMTSPAYGVYTLTQIYYADGGWNTGTFQFRFNNDSGNNMQLQVRYSSYYSSSATAYGYIMFTTV